MKRAYVVVCGLVVMFVMSGSPLAAQGFQYVKKSDPMNDEDRSSVFVVGDNQTSFVWTCDENGLGIVFTFDRLLTGRRGEVSVQIRLPPAQPFQPETWTLLTTSRGAVMPVGLVDDFSRWALTASNLVVRATDVDGSTVTGQFTITGLREALAKLPCAQPGAKRGVNAVAGNENALYEQALRQWNAGRADEAQKTLEDVLRLAPNHANAHYQLGMVYVNQGKLSQEEVSS
jgi:hypothetical protein